MVTVGKIAPYGPAVTALRGTTSDVKRHPDQVDQVGKWTLVFRACETRHLHTASGWRLRGQWGYGRLGGQRAVLRNGAELNHPCDTGVGGGDCLAECSKKNSAFII